MKRGNKRKFGRERAQRKALLKSLSTALISFGHITTTKAKAKTLSTHMDKLVTKAKHGTLASRRLLLTHLGSEASKKLVGDIAPRFSERQGGYTRVLRLERRRSDGSEMAYIEFTA